MSSRYAFVGGESILQAGLESVPRHSWERGGCRGRQNVHERAYRLRVRRRVDTWTMSPALVPMETFPLHIMHIRGNMYEDLTMFEMCRTFVFHNGLTSDADVPTAWI